MHRYECPRHRLACVLEVIKISSWGRSLTGLRKVEFYRCPFVHDGPVPQNVTGYDKQRRCTFMRPNKWQKNPISNDTRQRRTNNHLDP